MRDKLPLKVLLLVASVVAFFLLIPPRMPVTLAQVGADKRPTPTLSPKPKPKSTITHKTPQPPRFRPTDPHIEMVMILAGTFMMGSPESEAERDYDEGPQHRVTVQSFYMGRYEVTQAQYQSVMGANPSEFKVGNRPVEHVSWNDAVEFCRKLSQLTGRVYRLPTEAEWEYAARAGTIMAFAFGNSLSSDQANFDGNYPYGGAAKGVDRQKTTPVGSFQPNAWGLYDMHGNIGELCQDAWHNDYNGAPNDGSAWESGGFQQYRVARYGSWHHYASDCRSASRSMAHPDVRTYDAGFRVAADARPR